MHELSIAYEVCRMTEAHVGAERLGDVSAVGLEVGDDAGVEAGSLLFCMETLLSNPPFGSARPVIVRLPGDDLRLSYIEVDDDRPDD